MSIPSEHIVRLNWQRKGEDFAADSFDRTHRWTFGGGVEVAASAAADFHGNADCVNPEEGLVASLASCHMLTFLTLAARKRLVVDAYTDRPVGILDKNADGRLAITRVTLRPEVRFGPGVEVSDESFRSMHEKAHQHCFIAASVHAEVVLEPSR